MEKANIQHINVKKIKPNNGQIAGLPKNPRVIKDAKFVKLKKSIQENPEMLDLRPLLVFLNGEEYVVIGGNMRFKACKELGYKEIPCVIIPEAATIEQLKAYTIKDNNGYGEWDYSLLGAEWNAEDLDNWGVDTWQETAKETIQSMSSPNLQSFFASQPQQPAPQHFDGFQHNTGTAEAFQPNLSPMQPETPKQAFSPVDENQMQSAEKKVCEDIAKQRALEEFVTITCPHCMKDFQVNKRWLEVAMKAALQE